MTMIVTVVVVAMAFVIMVVIMIMSVVVRGSAMPVMIMMLAHRSPLCGQRITGRAMVPGNTSKQGPILHDPCDSGSRPRRSRHPRPGRRHQLRGRGGPAPAPDPAGRRAGRRLHLVQPRRHPRAPVDAFEPRRQPELEAHRARRALLEPHPTDVEGRGRPHGGKLLRRRLLQRAPQRRALRRGRGRCAELPIEPRSGGSPLRHGPLELQRRYLLQRLHDGRLRCRRQVGDPPAQGQAGRSYDARGADAADRRDLQLPDPVQLVQQLPPQAAGAGDFEVAPRPGFSAVWWAKTRSAIPTRSKRMADSDVGTRSLSSGRPKAGPVGFAHPTAALTPSDLILRSVRRTRLEGWPQALRFVAVLRDACFAGSSGRGSYKLNPTARPRPPRPTAPRCPRAGARPPTAACRLCRRSLN